MTATAPPPGHIGLTFVGCGVSTGVPVLGHLRTPCACADALAHPTGPNHRNNVSLLLTVPDYSEAGGQPAAAEAQAAVAGHDNFAFEAPDANTQEHPRDPQRRVPVRFALIDCGKTFRDAYFSVLVRHNVSLINSLWLSHDHQDAVGGLDDLRDLQRMHMGGRADAGRKERPGHWYIDHYIPTFLSNLALASLHNSVKYIVGNSQLIGEAATTAAAHAAAVEGYRQRREHEMYEAERAAIEARHHRVKQDLPEGGEGRGGGGGRNHCRRERHRHPSLHRAAALPAQLRAIRGGRGGRRSSGAAHEPTGECQPARAAVHTAAVLLPGARRCRPGLRGAGRARKGLHVSRLCLWQWHRVHGRQ
ncbi:hypothetical protein STCU_06066 [Strigomonas culicis]|uniref:Metallo-beta-lactamase domain-containing protein n=1 Tax=Strigomonas culicis TaxID=28005 RepID=S9UD03_9TRYP|nr:hypothetical protein STCU_06066 [Strigomonas culicis]|eukprot:EPY26813.1 hypothetical protein STCU_06066 [Strigomonas culicis]